MTELQQYLAEEVVEDHADGILTRRETLRRVGLLGVGAAVASSWLAAAPSRAPGRLERGAGASAASDSRRVLAGQAPAELAGGAGRCQEPLALRRHRP
jgi:carboxymethylenebutenolidase